MENGFDHERLDVYRYALEVVEIVVGEVPRGASWALRDQLERASLSIVLCIAEGAGRRAPRDKARFYSMGRGSATESAAIFDILKMRDLIPPETYLRARKLLLRIVRMLTALALSTLSAPEPEPEPEPAPRSHSRHTQGSSGNP